jgi:hypothetical protein
MIASAGALKQIPHVVASSSWEQLIGPATVSLDIVQSSHRTRFS